MGIPAYGRQGFGIWKLAIGIYPVNDMNYTDQIIDHAVGILRRKSIDGYEIYLHHSSHFDVESKDGKIETLQSSHFQGMALRILIHQHIGFSYSTFTNPLPSHWPDLPGRLDGMVEEAINNARAASEDSFFDFAPVLQTSPDPLPIFDETLEGISEKRKIEKATLLEEAVRLVDPEKIKKVRKPSYQEIISQKTLINSNGLQFSYPSTLTSISVTAIAEKKGESEVGWEFDTSHFINDLDIEKVGQAAGMKALERLGGKRISSGIYSILLRNHVASEFLSLLAHSFLAEQVQKGKSILKGKKGEKFFSPLLSIVDDGLHPKGIATSPIDGEGIPSQRTILVNLGEASNYLYDRYWANRENNCLSGRPTGSTGNSRRLGIKSPPHLGISNFFVEPGNFPSSSLMKTLYHGLIVEEVMGLHTVDLISGDFSLGCSGTWVDQGEKVHSVKSIAIAGNLFNLFQKIIGVGEDFRFFGGVGSPSLLVEGLEVSGN